MRVKTVPTESLMEIIRLQLEAGGRANLTVTGSSMLPMLRENWDSVILVPADRELIPGDIALYRNADERYILHRVIRVEKENYIICGDNQWQPENVPKDRVLAVVSEYAKKGKPHKLTETGYRLYRMVWVKFFCVRKYYIALRRWLGRLRRGA